MEKKQNLQSNIVIAAFVFLVFGLTIAGLFSPVRERSESENRTLAQKPEFTLESLFEKDETKRYTRKYEAFLTDQFIGRDAWIGIKTRVERMLGKTDINGVYFAKDGYLITRTDADAIDKEQEEKNIAALAAFLERYQKIYGADRVHAMIVPTAADILDEKLPAFTTEYNQDALLDRLAMELPEGSLLDSRGELNAHADEYLFYRTDHHWTALGAYYAYRAWAKETGHEIRELSEYDERVGSDEFYGTLYSKVNLPMQADSVMIYDDGRNYRVEYDMSQKFSSGLFVESRLEEKDKYMVYLDGNHAITHIVQNRAEKNDRRLLVIKDSYAHTFVPFLAQDYDEIVMIDFRYCKMPVSSIATQFGITDVLVLYNATNFIEDKTLYQLEK